VKDEEEKKDSFPSDDDCEILSRGINPIQTQFRYGEQRLQVANNLGTTTNGVNHSSDVKIEEKQSSPINGSGLFICYIIYLYVIFRGILFINLKFGGVGIWGCKIFMLEC